MSPLAQLRKIISILCAAWMSWLAMMLVHEIGHVLGAVASGGQVNRIVWHPLLFSRTELVSNPSPLIEMWSGPLFGCVTPAVLAGVLSAVRFRFSWLFWFFAGFCLLTNGLYLGTGVVDPVGDARDLRMHGTPLWVLGIFGLLAVPIGLYLLHRVSPHFGFGRTSQAISPRMTLTLFFLAVLMTEYGVLLGH